MFLVSSGTTLLGMNDQRRDWSRLVRTGHNSRPVGIGRHDASRHVPGRLATDRDVSRVVVTHRDIVATSRDQS